MQVRLPELLFKVSFDMSEEEDSLETRTTTEGAFTNWNLMQPIRCVRKH